MAETSNLDPRKVISATGQRIFTVAQANKTLPLVSRIASDIVALYMEMTQTQRELESQSLRAPERELKEKKLEAEEQKLDYYCSELEDIGCELKDPRLGLVDFIGRHEGRNVMLCWKLGEARIGFWHDQRSGFAGRRPVSQLREEELE